MYRIEKKCYAGFKAIFLTLYKNVQGDKAVVQ